MKKFAILAALLSAICLLSACADEGGRDTAPDSSRNVSVYENSKGNIVYEFNLDGEDDTSPDQEEILQHRKPDATFTLPSGAVSLQKAEEILDGCSSYRIYLPGKIQDFKKRFNKVIQYHDKDFYSVSLYMEKNSVRMYVGSDVIIACDGSEAYRLDVAGAYQPLEMDGAENDKDASALYPSAKTSPLDALFLLNQFDRNRIGLKENMEDYTFEVTDALVTKNSIPCYQVTP